jgi:transposase
MTKPYSEDLRIRAVEAVANGMSRRQVAKLFKVGASSVIRWTDQHERTGRVAAKPMGGSRGTSIEGADRTWLLRRIEAQSDLTLEEMRRELADQRNLSVGHGSVWRFCDREKLSLKKKACGPPNKTGQTSLTLDRNGGGCSPGWSPLAWCSSTRPGPRTT